MEDNVVLGAISELSKTVKKLSEKVEGMNNKVEGLNDKVDGMRSDMDGMRLDIDEMRGDVKELGRRVDGLSNEVKEFKEETNQRFYTLENVGIELKDEINGLRAREELVEIGLKTGKEEITKQINKIDSRIGNIESFVGGFVNIVANNVDKLDKKNEAEHQIFREALQIAN